MIWSQSHLFKQQNCCLSGERLFGRANGANGCFHTQVANASMAFIDLQVVALLNCYAQGIR
jgi:hypothetical protein